MKDECGGKQIVEFVGFRSKLYAYKMDTGKEEKKCKGVKKNVVKEGITIEDYKDCLFGGLYTETLNKKALSCDDDKRVIMEDEITTLALGHWRLREEFAHEDSKLRDELVLLSEKGLIKHTTAYIKKANQGALEKIKHDFDRKQLDEANEFISVNLIDKFSELMDSLNMVNDSDCEAMKQDLGANELLKKDLKNLVGNLTPYIPYIGLKYSNSASGSAKSKGI